MLALGILELACRLLPVSDSLQAMAVNSANPVLRFEENRDVTWSKGADFSIVTKKHVNNYGFLNDQDYRPEEQSPLLAIIGDSYVEAVQVENSRSMHGIVSEETRGSGRVYSFGASGCPLSGYLAYANYAAHTFHADAMVFIVVGNDFDESLTKYNSTPGFHYFSPTASRQWELVRKDYRPTPARQLARRSALVRYLALNAQVSWRSAEKLFAGNAAVADRVEFVGNTAAAAHQERVSDSETAIDRFFAELPHQTGLGNKDILFVLDGMRPELYRETALQKASGTYFDIMRRYFINVAASNGYEIIDLQPAFIEKHETDGTRFEFASDNHWNEAGHRLVAKEISASAVYRRLFGNQATLGARSGSWVPSGSKPRSRAAVTPGLSPPPAFSPAGTPAPSAVSSPRSGR